MPEQTNAAEAVRAAKARDSSRRGPRTAALAPPVLDNPLDADAAERGVCVVSDRYPPFDGHWHAHQSAQFVYACEGMLTTHTQRGTWIVPPHRAVWLPPGMVHKVAADRPVRLRTLYVKPGAADTPSEPGVVTVDPLLDALLAEAATFGTDYPLGGREERLIAVILDRLPNLGTVPSYLPTPADPRLVRLTTALQAQPADARTLDELAAACGMTARTAARLFAKETGLTFAQWRQQLRLLKGMQWLSQGRSVTEVALEVGYLDVSGFITVFKQAFGDTPARYFRRGG